MPTTKDVVLVVDDERVNIKVLASLLKPHYTTLVATNGEQALRRCQAANKPDLILLDIVMKDMDGYEVCRQLKENETTKKIPIIFISGKNDVDDETKGFDLGAVDYITKPFHPSIVSARVRTHLKLKRNLDLLEKICSLDGLLEIPNRRRFEDVLKNEWKRARREQTELSLIIVDIDYFKQYNDTYGHANGDECLKQVSQEMARHCRRPADFIARYGGEEFVVVLPNTHKQGALEIAEDIRAGVETLCIEHLSARGECKTVTISLGVASTIPTDETRSLDLVKAADAMLYMAKEAGRNRVMS